MGVAPAASTSLRTAAADAEAGEVTALPAGSGSPLFAIAEGAAALAVTEVAGGAAGAPDAGAPMTDDTDVHSRRWRVGAGRAIGGCHPYTTVPEALSYTTVDAPSTVPLRGPATWASRDALLVPRPVSAWAYATSGYPTWACGVTAHVKTPIGQSVPFPVVHRSEHYIPSHNAIAATGTRGGGDLCAAFGELKAGTQVEISDLLGCIERFFEETESAQIATGPRPVLRSEIAMAVDAEPELDWRSDDVAQAILLCARALHFEDGVAAVDAADAAAFGQLVASGLVLGLSGAATAVGLGVQTSNAELFSSSAFLANVARQLKHFYNPFRLDRTLASEGFALGRMGLGPLPPAVEEVLGSVEAVREPVIGLSSEMRAVLSGPVTRRGHT